MCELDQNDQDVTEAIGHSYTKNYKMVRSDCRRLRPELLIIILKRELSSNA